jgi:hypothetical protein
VDEPKVPEGDQPEVGASPQLPEGDQPKAEASAEPQAVVQAKKKSDRVIQPQAVAKTGPVLVSASKASGSKSASSVKPVPVKPAPVKWERAVSDLANQTVHDLTRGFMPTPSGVQEIGDVNKLKAFVRGMDPFGLLQVPPGTTDSANAKYKALRADQWQAFLGAVSITGPTASTRNGWRTAPNQSALDKAISGKWETESGVPKLQHSIWVGGPLQADVPKHKAFMDQLVKNRKQNPGWDVCLWTDQSRTDVLAAAADSPLGKYRAWAAKNNIRLIPIDEVFAGDNAMQLGGLFKLEQMKGGTGRAAASDMLRLEIVNRFGGVYCDGDKPINQPLATIASHTASMDGFTTAQERGSFQNCGMCAVPGNPIVAKVLDTIQKNYGQPRDHLVPKARQNRPTRFEVILRTGPSVVRDVALAEETPKPEAEANSKHLMPPDFITPPAVYTTSWDPSIVPCYGDRDLGAFVRNNDHVESSATAQSRVAADVVQLRTRMQAPHAQVAHTPEQQAAQVAAVKKGVTALVYGVWNSDGLLNMDLAEQHIKSAPDRDLARDMIVQILNDPQMGEVTRAVKTLQLPGNAATKDSPPSAIPVPESTLDALFRRGQFPNLRVQDFTVQHAAYMGNTQFIDYAQRYNLLDLKATSTRTLEAGQRMQGDRTYATSQNTVLTAAMRGGQRDVLAQLSGRPEFGDLLTTAAGYGQLETVLWALHALPASDTAVPLEQLLSLKRPTIVAEEGIPLGSPVLLDDEECLYIFDQFRQGVQTETGALPNMQSASYAKLLLDAISVYRRPNLAARMESVGADLTKLSSQDRKDLADQLAGTNINIPTYTNLYLQLAGKADLVSELITGSAGRQVPNLDTVKNDYATVPADANNSKELLDYLSKGLAYAQSHIDDNNAGRGSRVDGWRAGVKQVLNLLGAISSSKRKPEQEALLDAATLVSAKLQEMKRSSVVT